MAKRLFVAARLKNRGAGTYPDSPQETLDSLNITRPVSLYLVRHKASFPPRGQKIEEKAPPPLSPFYGAPAGPGDGSPPAPPVAGGGVFHLDSEGHPFLVRRLWFALLVAGGTAWSVPLNEQEVYIRWARFRFGLTGKAECVMRAQLRLEDGPKGCEAGMKMAQPRSVYEADIQAYADPTMPDGAEQHSRLSRRILKSLQAWVLENPKRRAAWMEAYAAAYLRDAKGEGGMTNYEYFRLLQRLYNEESGKVAGFNPVSSTVPQ